MLSRSNKHIKKYNQLVEVHDPEGIEQLETVTSRDDSKLRERLEEIRSRRDAVDGLTSEAFFDESERVQIAESDSMPSPAAAADSKREELLARLDEIEVALEDALEAGETLDTSDDLEL